MNRLLAWAGIDPDQWRALARAYLKMDLRRGGGPQPVNRPAKQSLSSNPFTPLIIASLVNSIAAGLLVIVLHDIFTAAVAVVTLAALNTALMVLMDFTGSVVSASDYWIIAARPISSRTYFAARIAAVLVYIGTGAAVMAAFPAAAFFFRHTAGLAGALAVVATTVACCVAVACAAIAAYTFLIGHLHPRRLTRAMTLLQVFATGASLTVFYVALQGIEQTAVRHISIADVQWVWALPTTWFAAVVPAIAGIGADRHWIASAAAVAFTAGALLTAAGRLSLEFAERLAEATSASEPARRGAVERVPGFSHGESYAVATLIRAQFRYDTRFRLAVLSILPLMLFYLMLGLEGGVLRDPFTPGEHGSGPIYLAITFLPMTLHASIRYSDHWRASWIFFAFPASPARLVVAAKNFVAVFFLGGYLLALACVWSFFYERVWHAALHAAVIGAAAHMMLQAAVLVSPLLPFAVEPRRADQSGRVLMLFFIGSIAAATFPVVLPVIYARPSWTVVLVILLSAATYFFELAVRRRVREAVSHLEFT